jgi:hypothetical protein
MIDLWRCARVDRCPQLLRQAEVVTVVPDLRDLANRALLTTLHQTQSALERQRGITAGHEGQVLSLARSAPATAHFPLCNSRDASRPALLLIQADISAVVRGVKAGEFDYPT